MIGVALIAACAAVGATAPASARATAVVTAAHRDRTRVLVRVLMRWFLALVDGDEAARSVDGASRRTVVRRRAIFRPRNAVDGHGVTGNIPGCAHGTARRELLSRTGSPKPLSVTRIAREGLR